MAWREALSVGQITTVIGWVPPTYTVATLPTPAASNTGLVVFCSDGNAGEETLVRSSGSAWIALASGAAAATA